MTDAQILTLAIAVIFPVSMLLYSNSRVSEAKETLRAEMLAMKGEILVLLTHIDNKLDHVVETQAGHSERLDRLEKKG